METLYKVANIMGNESLVDGNAVNGNEDPRAAQKSTLFQGLNDGSADLAAQISGIVPGGNRTDVRLLTDELVVQWLTRLAGCSILHQQ